MSEYNDLHRFDLAKASAQEVLDRLEGGLFINPDAIGAYCSNKYADLPYADDAGLWLIAAIRCYDVCASQHDDMFFEHRYVYFSNLNKAQYVNGF